MNFKSKSLQGDPESRRWGTHGTWAGKENISVLTLGILRRSGRGQSSHSWDRSQYCIWIWKKSVATTGCYPVIDRTHRVLGPPHLSPYIRVRLCCLSPTLCKCDLWAFCYRSYCWAIFYHLKSPASHSLLIPTLPILQGQIKIWPFPYSWSWLLEPSFRSPIFEVL